MKNVWTLENEEEWWSEWRQSWSLWFQFLLETEEV